MRHRLTFSSFLLCLSCLLALAQGCGGGQPGLRPASAVAPAVQPLAVMLPGRGFTVTVLQDSLAGGATVERFDTELVDAADGTGVMLIVHALAARDLKALLLECSYDPACWQPDTAEVLPAFGNAEDTLCLCLSGRRGTAAAGVVQRRWGERRGFSGSGPLLRVLFLHGAHGVQRAGTAVPQGAVDRAHLSWVAGPGELQWEYRCTGDYDQNGLVGLTDILPLALYYGDTAPGAAFPDSSARAVADGNRDGRINLADLTPLGANWGVSVLGGYSVYRSQDETDYPADAGVPPIPALRVGTADFAAGGAAPGARKRFSFQVPDPAPGDCYWVRPSDSANDGTPSTLARYAPNAAGAWPMPYHDPQRTSCSPYVGPADPQVQWTFRPDVSPDYVGYTGVATAPDGTAYFSTNRDLQAYYPNGGLKWNLEGIRPKYAATVAPDGSVYIDALTYVGDDQTGYLLALDAGGRIRWHKELAAPPRSVTGADGTVYTTCSDNFLRAFAPDGTLKWSFDAGVPILPPPYIGPSGIVYLNSGAMVYAFTAEGQLLWQLDIKWATDNAPVEAPDMTVYIANDMSLIGINPDGTARFQYCSPDGWTMNYGPLVGANNNAYVTCYDGRIYALSHTGALIWKYETQVEFKQPPVMDPQGRLCYLADGKVQRLIQDGTPDEPLSLEVEDIVRGPVYDTAGRVFVYYSSQLQVLDSAGHVLWTSVSDANFERDVTLAADGTIYAVSTRYDTTTRSYIDTLNALDKDGRRQWAYSAANIRSDGALSAAGAMLAVTSDLEAGYLSSISPAGTVQWNTPLTQSFYQFNLVVGADACYTHNGTTINKYDLQGEHLAAVETAQDHALQLGLDSQGNVILGYGNRLGKYDPALELLAELPVYYMHRFCLGPDGAIYVTGHADNFDNHFVLALNPDLTERWRYEMESVDAGFMQPSLGSDGVVYCVYTEYEAIAKPAGGYTHNYYDRILALSSAGELKWTTERMRRGLLHSNVAVDAGGNVYVVCSDGVRSFDAAGQPRWHVLFLGSYNSNGQVHCPALGADGTLYVANPAGKLYALHD